MCFPASARLTLKNGDLITMQDLKIGDEVQTLDPTTNESIYSDVVAFLHKDTEKEEFRAIEGEDGSRLVLSDKHLIYSGRTKKSMKMVFADEIRPKDFILSRDTITRVAIVTTVYDSGVYAPMTRHGTMVVNGVYVSCYAHWSSHEVSHRVMAPIRLWYDLSNVVRKIATVVGIVEPTQSDVLSKEFSKGVHVYADFLMTFVRYLPQGISAMYSAL